MDKLVGPEALIVFDVEADGFRGTPFAWGGCVLRRTLDRVAMPMSVRDRTAVIASPWVREHVLPNLRCEASVDGTGNLLGTFSNWLCSAREAYPDAWIVMDCGYPVDVGILLRCEDAALSLPILYPLHELATLLECAGIGFDNSRRVLLAMYDTVARTLPEHNPESDAEASARCAAIALRRLGLWPALPSAAP